MSNPTPQRDLSDEERRFVETLEKNRQLADVAENADTSKLPPRITHVRYPDGRIKRIRFTGLGRG